MRSTVQSSISRSLRGSLIAEDIGFAPVDTGSLRNGGRLQQPGGPLYTRVISGADAATLRRGEEARTGGPSGEAQHPSRHT